jgi:hypothetical protein
MDDMEQAAVIRTDAPFAHRTRAKLTKNTKGYGFEITAEVTDNGQPLTMTLTELAATIDGTLDRVRAAVKRQELLDAGYPAPPPIEGVDGQSGVETIVDPPDIPPPDDIAF